MHERKLHINHSVLEECLISKGISVSWRADRPLDQVSLEFHLSRPSQLGPKVSGSISVIIVAHVRWICFKMNLYIQDYQEILVDPAAPGFLFHPADQVFLLTPSVLSILLSPLRKHMECQSSSNRVQVVSICNTSHDLNYLDKWPCR